MKRQLNVARPRTPMDRSRFGELGDGPEQVMRFASRHPKALNAFAGRLARVFSFNFERCHDGYFWTNASFAVSVFYHPVTAAEEAETKTASLTNDLEKATVAANDCVGPRRNDPCQLSNSCQSMGAILAGENGGEIKRGLVATERGPFFTGENQNRRSAGSTDQGHTFTAVSKLADRFGQGSWNRSELPQLNQGNLEGITDKRNPEVGDEVGQGTQQENLSSGRTYRFDLQGLCSCILADARKDRWPDCWGASISAGRLLAGDDRSLFQLWVQDSGARLLRKTKVAVDLEQYRFSTRISWHQRCGFRLWVASLHASETTWLEAGTFGLSSQRDGCRTFTVDSPVVLSADRSNLPVFEFEAFTSLYLGEDHSQRQGFTKGCTVRNGRKLPNQAFEEDLRDLSQPKYAGDRPLHSGAREQDFGDRPSLRQSGARHARRFIELAAARIISTSETPQSDDTFLDCDRSKRLLGSFSDSELFGKGRG